MSNHCLTLVIPNHGDKAICIVVVATGRFDEKVTLVSYTISQRKGASRDNVNNDNDNINVDIEKMFRQSLILFLIVVRSNAAFGIACTSFSRPSIE
jgi:hypothetical protein